MKRRIKKRTSRPVKNSQNIISLLVALGVLLLVALAYISVKNGFFKFSEASASSATFYNPIMSDGADPSVVYKDGFYYYTQTTGNNVSVWRSETISGISKGTKVVVWTPPASGPTCCNIWAPELLFLNNKWYIYFAADDGQSYNNHRMYVLESNTTDPQGSYTEKGKIYDPNNDKYAIDGTVLQKTDGSLYFIWSGKNTDPETTQNLYIAPMNNPWTINGSRVLLSTPTYPWETSVAPINEGPESLIKNGKIIVVYAANASWTDEYNLGMLTNTDGNILTPSSWTKNPNSIFSKTSEVFGPGHGTFTKSPDGTEDWIIYHAAKYSGAGWSRNIRAQKYTWNPDDIPNLGTPVPGGLSLPLPSGEGLACSTCNIYYGWGSSASGTLVKGTWNLISDTAASITSLGAGWQHLFRGDVASTDYTVSAQAKWVATGTTSNYPKYGIYATYKDSSNYVAAFLDKNNKVLATFGKVQGVDQNWQNSRINVNFGQFHTIKVVKNGTTFQFYLDNKLYQTRTFNISNGQIGLVTEDTKADYQNVTISLSAGQVSDPTPTSGRKPR